MNTVNKKIILAGMTLNELEKFTEENNEPKFRAKQLHYWLYKKCVPEFDNMSNLSKEFRAKLNNIAQISDTKIKQRLISKDGTIKYLLEFPDGNVVETVLMRFDNRPNLTACVSSQIGCPVGCIFCATGERGFVRNLTAKEIIDQILTIQRDTGLIVTNIVYMGQGEPLLNLDEVLKSVHIINSELEIGMRRITISTSGIAPQIYKLADENRQLTLALSLHAPNHELRERLIPIEKKYNIEEVVKALHFLTEKTGRRVTIEYMLIDGINDSPDHAKQISYLLKGLNYNVNLIPYNSLNRDDFKTPSAKKINIFKYILEQSGKKVTVRLERGSDILAACGQLSGKVTP
ncbi:MAG: 23S rRNA (adenine(2503)-C(2))-methyltransferase [Candidatus Melainabacteria bacterium RIFOXYA12_FULL_32_12]|nr:MAG: 23S rRNA (adenine(2503)-C(2))-methyltransferase [Candidatus Melainabacteria bacterium RIFOXYA2_FULL_32_9]OGI29888.1 MAG: 23S rRNA (adenine(2503)-C(2))-methyltransferase [Candidatus Melainabacteria bacterium RIFOXYA12_FULL_32_12]